MSRALFKNIEESELEKLKDIYYPIFDGLEDMTYEDAYVLAKDLSGLSESATRNNMERLYAVRNVSSDTDMDAVWQAREYRLNQRTHNLSRERIAFNQIRRETFDELYLMQDFVDKIKHIEMPSIRTILDSATLEDLNSRYYDKVVHIMLADLHIGKYEYHEHDYILIRVLDGILANVRLGAVIDVSFLGDTIDGLLRLSQLQQIKANQVDQTVWAMELIINFLSKLSEHYYIRGVNFIDESNHDEVRPLGSQRGDFNDVNFSKIVSASLSNYCTAHKIKFNSGEKICTIVGDKSFLLLHGHQFKGVVKMREYYEGVNIIHAHFHNHYEISKATHTHIGMPPLVGGDEYTASLGIKESETQPGFLIMSEFGNKVVYI